MSLNIPRKHHTEKFDVHLIDTSSYGIAFYVSYHRWVATAKESFLLKKVKNFTELFEKLGIKLIILESMLKIHKEIKLHEKINVIIYCSMLKKMKAHLKYVITKGKNEMVAEAENKIVFVNKFNKLVRIPQNVYDVFLTIYNEDVE